MPLAPLLRLRILYLLMVWHRSAAQFTSLPRWGQATAVVTTDLFVHGGKTDQFNAFSYTAAPTNNDLLHLDLSVAFDPSSPPWQLLSSSSTSAGPALAWHTLSAFNSSQLLMFGGDGGPNSPIVLPNQPNSAWLLDVSNRSEPNWMQESQSWASEPNRRIHHAASSTSGEIWVVGGEKDDGSMLGYSDHYVFNPAVPAFSQLPSNGPPDLYGHASIVLSNGSLLVFGGYSASESQLLPFNTIWSMDTTQSTLSWSTLSVSDSPLPPPRRAFAAVLLSGDKILIHGGADPDLQTSFSDGWILDTSSSPMVWSNVSALTQLGPRRDHFAIAVGSQVLFGFGYGLNSGAPASLSIFDVNSGSFASSFTPPVVSPPTTLPAPSGTNAPGHTPTNSNGSPTQSGGGISGSGGQSVRPTSTNPSDPSDPHNSPDSDEKKTTRMAVALGTAFGCVAFVVVATGAFVCARRRRRGRGRERFRLIGSEDVESPVSAAGGGFGTQVPRKIRLAGSGWFAAGADRNPWTYWGLGRAARRARHDATTTAVRSRMDMLADEDVRDFDVRSFSMRRDGSGSSRSWYSGYAHESVGARPTLGRVLAGSLSSLRSVGAMISSNVGIGGGSIRRGPSEGSVNPPAWWEKSQHLPLDPFSDDAALLLDEGPRVGIAPMTLGGVGGVGAGMAARPRGGYSSETSDPYVDPFEDQVADVLFNAGPEDDEKDAEGNDDADSDRRDLHRSSSHSSHRSSRPPLLMPLVTVPSRNSGSDPATSSSSSHEPPSNHSSSAKVSTHSSYDTTSRGSSGRPHTTSIIGAQTAPSLPMRRSDSWWTRFRRTSFREPALDPAKSPTRGAFDIRDPNPAPRLDAIREASQSGSPESPEQAAARARAGLYPAGSHGRSMSSLQTAQTADSEAIERMGSRMDVVQRDATMSSHQTTPSTAEDSPDLGDAWHAAGRLPPDGDGDDGARSAAPVVDSPTEHEPPDAAPPSDGSTSADGARTPVKKPPSRGVAARVAEYERRMSQDTVVSPGGVKSPTRSGAVSYGLVPKAELFVANPDRRAGRSSDA